MKMNLNFWHLSLSRYLSQRLKRVHKERNVIITHWSSKRSKIWMTMIIVIHILYFRIAVSTVYLQFIVMYFCLILKHTNSQSNSFADTCWSFAVSATKVLGSQHFCSFSMKQPKSWITASFSPDMVDSRSGSRSTCKTWTKLDLIRLNIKNMIEY